ncbi:hypothetical protein C9F11_37285 [Streptomyces sp. YIM 121038]|uniref:hypothetical protein n=1 Tax=Streptomyces sp. YIM 121038 TaxID=2136401 RepID=UPI0011104B1B|nr:hypothetical protein [Streptomyces sp. YIM 121038]QCX81040.1 hypothetical protein C9F11_37285 [Streptomyces sp. YIM 121038]
MTIGFAELPVPVGGDSPTIPADIAELASVLDPHLVQHAVDQADRDATYAAAPVQTLVIAQNGTTWIKTSSVANTWVTIWEPMQTWQSTLTLKAGFEEGAVDLGIRRLEGGHVYLKGRVQRIDGNNIEDANAVNLGSVPSSLVPEALGTWAGTCSMAGTTTLAAGRMEVLGDNTSSAYGDPGDLLWWYQGPGGTGWVDISGDYWLD